MKMLRAKEWGRQRFVWPGGLFVTIVGAHMIIWYAQTKIPFHRSTVVDITPGDLGVKLGFTTTSFATGILPSWSRVSRQTDPVTKLIWRAVVPASSTSIPEKPASRNI